MRRALFMAGNVVAAVALVQLILDPTRGLRPALALVGAGVLKLASVPARVNAWEAQTAYPPWSPAPLFVGRR